MKITDLSNYSPDYNRGLYLVRELMSIANFCIACPSAASILIGKLEADVALVKAAAGIESPVDPEA